MKKRLELQRNIFAHVFRLSNILQVYLDNQLKVDQLTSKQMLLMISIYSFGEHAPTFKEAADRSGSSYQNIKQIALKLEKNGYVKINNDSYDGRTKRLLLTEQAAKYWDNRDSKDMASMEKLFREFSSEELAQFQSYILTLQKGVKYLDE